MILLDNYNSDNRAEMNRLLDNQDFYGAANLLQQFISNDPSKQRWINQQVLALRQQGNELQGLLRGANDDERQAISFKYGLEHNALPKMYVNSSGQQVANKYTQQFQEWWNGLGGPDGATIRINFDSNTDERRTLGMDWFNTDVTYDKSGFELFMDQNGLDESQLKAMGATVTHDTNGRTYLDIPRNSENLQLALKMLNGVRNVTTGNSSIGGMPNSSGDKGFDRYRIEAVNSKGQTILNDETMPLDSYHDFVVADGDIAGRINSQNRGFWDSMGAAIKYQGQNLGRTLFGTGVTEDNSRANESLNLPSGDSYFALMDHVDSIISNKRNKADDPDNNIINLSTIQVLSSYGAKYDMMVKAGAKNEQINQQLDQYLNLLGTVGLEHMNVWADNNKTSEDEGFGDNPKQNVLTKLNSKDAAQLNSLLHQAAAQKKLNFVEAQVDGKIGVYITIQPDIAKQYADSTNDPEKNPWSLIFKTGSEKEEYTTNANEIRIFVEDLWDDDAEDALKNDTNTKAGLEIGNMKAYGYSYEIPDVGTIEKVNSDGSALFKAKGTDTSVSINSTQLQQMMVRSKIYEDAAQQAVQTFIDPSTGKIKEGVDAESHIKKLAPALISEIMPVEAQSYLKKIQKEKDKSIKLDDMDEYNLRQYEIEAFNLQKYIMEQLGFYSNI